MRPQLRSLSVFSHVQPTHSIDHLEREMDTNVDMFAECVRRARWPYRVGALIRCWSSSIGTARSLQEQGHHALVAVKVTGESTLPC
jgi:hypothetical protein